MLIEKFTHILLSKQLQLFNCDAKGSCDLDKTLYSSPYMIFTENEYTKHYYVENQRLVTKIGGGFEYRIHEVHDHIPEINTSSGYTNLNEALYENIYRKNQCLYDDGNVSFDISNEIISLNDDNIANNESEEVIYFFHSDHLGSSSFITDAGGNADKHFQYLPFGENFISEQNSTFNTRYEFSGKEKDMATGYNYFGARYYNSDVSIWLSVDPLFDKYPSMSPYMYCAGNPVMLVDPDGRKIGKGKDFFQRYKTHVDNMIKSSYDKALELKFKSQKAEANNHMGRKKRLEKRSNNQMKESRELNEVFLELCKLETSDITYNYYVNCNDIGLNCGGTTSYNIAENQVDIKVKGSYNLITIAHESKHAYQFEIGKLSFNSVNGGGGLLYDIQDEVEAYSRGALFGGRAYTTSEISKMSVYKEIWDRTTQRQLKGKEFEFSKFTFKELLEIHNINDFYNEP